MNDDNNDDNIDILNDPPAVSDLEQAINSSEDNDVVAPASYTDAEDAYTPSSGEILYDEESINLQGESLESIQDLITSADHQMGGKALDTEVRTPGTWANILFRMIMDPNYEEMRAQKALSLLTPEEAKNLSYRFRTEDNKIALRTSPIVKKVEPGGIRHLSGQEALLAFSCQEVGGGFRVPLYNSGLTIDILAPTGNDLQTLLTNCSVVDKELGSALGGHYFTYNDTMIKTQILNFLQPLIINSSYADWKKKEKLWAAIKLPDLSNIVATIAAICYPDGYENFTVSCKRPVTEEHPKLCGHVEKVKADIFKLIVTRFSSMSKDSIDHMIQARIGNKTHTAAEIAKYQAALGYEGEKITFGNITFTMKIPSLSEHLEAGAEFLADIINEVEGDNTQGREEQIGFRYMRTFLPWIGTVERVDGSGDGFVTSDRRTIIRALEVIDNDDDDGVVRDKFVEFVGRSQLTYVGHPILPCKVCGHIADTPSGMWTFDPFSTFFTLAFLYLKPSDSSKIPTA